MFIFLRFNRQREAKFIHDMLPAAAPAEKFADLAGFRRDILIQGKRLCYFGAAVVALAATAHGYNGRYHHAAGGAAAAVALVFAARARRDGVVFHDGLLAASAQGVPQARSYLRDAMKPKPMKAG
jgi:hypothetical protein